MDSGEKPPLPYAATAGTLIYAALPEFMTITRSRGHDVIIVSSFNTKGIS
jgi:hypothetical protein